MQRHTPGRLAIAAITVGLRHRREMGDVAGLAASIAALGLLQPLVVLRDGTLVAGARRLEAVQRLGWKQVPVHVVDNLDDAVKALQAERDENVCRKEFTLSEAVSLAETLEPLERAAAKQRQRRSGGANPGSAKFSEPPALAQVASHVGMSRPTLAKAKAIVQAAAAQPQKYGKLKDDMDRTGKASGVYRRLQTLQQAERIAREPAPWPEGPFRVIVLDPPWEYQKRTADPTHRGVTPYPTMSPEQIQSLDIGRIAHADCTLWLWTTNAHQPDAFKVLEAWERFGFTYKTKLTWVKDRMGTGDWLRGQSEDCLLAVRGKPVVTLTDQSTVLYGPARDHSQKPESFYERVEGLCPGSKVELFARQQRPGWACWGSGLNRS